MKLYEVQATEYNSEQEYSQSKLLAAENIDQAWQTARNYFRQWYDDGDEPEDHNTDNTNEFEFVSGCIRLKIKSIQEITLDEWIDTQIKLHSISDLPERVFETDLTKAAKCAIADLEGYLEYIDIPRDDPKHPAALTRRELAAIAKYSFGKTPDTKLRYACRQRLDTLDIGGEQARQFAEEIEMLKEALKVAPAVKDDCPNCGANSDERELISKDFLGIEAIHMHYLCEKCGSEIIEEFTLTDVFIDNPTT